MPIKYTLVVEVPDDKGFGRDIEDVQKNLVGRWIGFAESNDVYDKLVVRMIGIKSWAEKDEIADESYENNMLVKVLDEWFERVSDKFDNYENKTDEEKLVCYRTFTFKLLSCEEGMEMFRKVVFVGAMPGKILKVDSIDTSSVEQPLIVCDNVKENTKTNIEVTN